MVPPRVTSTAGGQLMLANLQRTYRTLTQLQDQMSSGKAIRRPSDDPAKVISALDYRAQLRRSEQFERNATDARNWLESADTAMTTAQSYLQRARDLLLQGLNGAADLRTRDAVATEIEELRDGLLQLARTRYQDRPIFNGTSTYTAVYDAAYRYLGDPTEAATGQAVARPVAPGVSLRVNTTAPEIFGAYDGTDPYAGNVFQILTQIATDLRDPSGPEAARQGLDGIDRIRRTMAGVQAELGARARRLDDVIARAADVTLELRSSLAEVEDIDLPRTIILVKQQEMAYQAALSVTARVVQPSLVDFLG